MLSVKCIHCSARSSSEDTTLTRDQYVGKLSCPETGIMIKMILWQCFEWGFPLSNPKQKECERHTEKQDWCQNHPYNSMIFNESNWKLSQNDWILFDAPHIRYNRYNIVSPITYIYIYPIYHTHIYIYIYIYINRYIYISIDIYIYISIDIYIYVYIYIHIYQ